MGFFQKNKNGNISLTNNSTSGNIFEETQNTNPKEYMHPMVVAVLFITAKIWKQPKCPTVDVWVKELRLIYTMEYYSSVKIEWNHTFCESVDGCGAHYVKRKKSVNERLLLYDFTCM